MRLATEESVVEGVTLNPVRGRTDVARDGVRALETGVAHSGR